MANECMNYITIKGDKELLQIFADSYFVKKDDHYYLDFNVIAPIPKDCENDYDYRIYNWGNKWDGTHGDITFWGEDEIFIDVTTAWSPCEPITTKLISLCPGLYIYHEYYEGGMGFIGWIEHHPNEGPDEYEQVDYSIDDDPEKYWFWMFEKEFETLDWLYEVVSDCAADEEISEEDENIIHSMLEHNSIEEIVEYCVEKGVLR